MKLRPVYTCDFCCDFMRDFRLLIDVNEWISCVHASKATCTSVQP